MYFWISCAWNGIVSLAWFVRGAASRCGFTWVYFF